MRIILGVFILCGFYFNTDIFKREFSVGTFVQEHDPSGPYNRELNRGKKKMDIHIIVKLKSSYEAWHKLFVDDADNRSKICDESKTLVGKANDATAW